MNKKKMASLLTLGLMLSGCTSDKQQEDNVVEQYEVNEEIVREEKVFAPYTHYIQIYSYDDIDGQIPYHEGYELIDTEITIGRMIVAVYIYQNVEEVVAVQTVREKCGEKIYAYDDFGTPTRLLELGEYPEGQKVKTLNKVD